MQLDYIDINDIDLDNTWLRYSFPLNDEKLNRSLEKNGILQPVTAVRFKGRYLITDGWKRANFAKWNSLKLPAQIFMPDELNEKKRLVTSITINQLNRELNVIEKAHIISIIVNDLKLSPEEIYAEICTLIDIKASDKLIKVLLFAAFMTDELKLISVKNGFTLINLTDFTLWDHSLLTQLLPLFLELNIRGSKLHNVMTLIFEITKRESIDVTEILDSVRFSELVNSPNLTSTQKYEHVYKNLYSLRYPLFSKQKENALKATGSLNPPGNISVTPPDNLEGSGFILKANLKNEEQLKQLELFVRSLKNNDRVKDLFGSS